MSEKKAAPGKRPAHVPESARWSTAESCWEDGPRGDGGAPRGAWTGWRPDGSVLWTATYHPEYHGSLHGKVTYFDPAGEVAKIELYDCGILQEPGKRQAKERKVPAATIRAAWRKAGGDATSPYRDLLQLDAALRAAKHADYKCVAWKPVDAGDVARAERKLGVKLPPSYVRFVTTHGVFVISGDDQDRYDEVSTRYHRLLPPLEVASVTLARRKHDDFEFLHDGLCFQANLYDDNFYAFRVSSARKDGEMRVGVWYHDEPGQWPRRFHGFEDHLRGLCQEWLDTIT